MVDTKEKGLNTQGNRCVDELTETMTADPGPAQV